MVAVVGWLAWCVGLCEVRQKIRRSEDRSLNVQDHFHAAHQIGHRLQNVLNVLAHALNVDSAAGGGQLERFLRAQAQLGHGFVKAIDGCIQELQGQELM